MILSFHTPGLLSQISRNSILPLRLNHRTLLPGNFYPFMRFVESNEESEL